MIANRTAWLRERQQCVMATDLPRLCGVYFDGEDGAANVYREKTTPVPADDNPDLRMRLGTFLEPFVADELANATGCKLIEVGGITRHKDEPWIGATLDREVFPHGWPAECKVVFHSPDEEFGDEASDKIPERMFLQVQWQMHAAGAEQSFVGVLFVPYRFQWFKVAYDPELAGMLVAIASDFRLRVLERRGVEDWRHPLIVEAVERACRVDPNRSVLLGQKELANADRFFELGKIISAQTEERHGLKVQLMKAMGQAEYGLLPDGSKLKRSRTRDLLTRQTRKGKR